MVKIYKVAHRRLRTGISQTETETDTKSNNTTQHNTTQQNTTDSQISMKLYSVHVHVFRGSIVLHNSAICNHFSTCTIHVSLQNCLYTVSLPFPVQTPGFLCKYSAVLVPLWWSELQIQNAWCKRAKYVRHRRYATYWTRFSATVGKITLKRTIHWSSFQIAEQRGCFEKSIAF